MSFGVGDSTCTLLKVVSGQEPLAIPSPVRKFVQALRPLLNHLFEVYPDSVEAAHSQQVKLVLEPDVKGIPVL